MTSFFRSFKWIDLLLIFVPASIFLHYAHGVNALWVFIAAALAIVPLAGFIGKSTEELALHLGSTWGGLLNATFGNATELIIGLFALHEGLISLVRASIVGSVISNILLVLGASILAGGIKHRTQTFNQDQAESHAINLLLAALSLAIPAIFAESYHHTQSALNPDIQKLSLLVAGILLVVYLASLWFSLRTQDDVYGCIEEPGEKPQWKKSTALLTLAITTAVVALESEFLVESVQGAARSLGVNQVFIGIIIIAIVGNAAEHATAVMMALKNKMDITINIAIGSSTQIAMFVAPVLVFASLLLGHPMTFIFSVPELTAIGFSVVIAAFIAGDGKSHWLEGAQLLAAYAIIALAFFFLPPDNIGNITR